MSTEKMRRPSIVQVHVFLAYVLTAVTIGQVAAILARGGPVYPGLYVAGLLIYTAIGFAKTFLSQSDTNSQPDENAD